MVGLLNKKQDNDSDYDKKLFEQYKMYVELADRISQRRSVFFVKWKCRRFEYKNVVPPSRQTEGKTL